MDNIVKSALTWIGRIVAEEVNKPIRDLQMQVDKLEKRVTELHEPDAIAKECDLSVMDDRICYLIGKCREKGYTTANDRRIIGRMHEAYKARGGNHGEENEYRVFLRIPTEEEYMRRKGASLQ